MSQREIKSIVLNVIVNTNEGDWRHTLRAKDLADMEYQVGLLADLLNDYGMDVAKKALP